MKNDTIHYLVAELRQAQQALMDVIFEPANGSVNARVITAEGSVNNALRAVLEDVAWVTEVSMENERRMLALMRQLSEGAGDPSVCPVCRGRDVGIPLSVCKSKAGFYVGTRCEHCGAPYGRYSLYFQTADEAHTELEEMTVRF